MIWYASISRPSGRTVLHLQDLRTVGLANEPLESPADVRAFLAAHPEVDVVMFYAAWMPRRAVPVAKVTDAMLRRAFSTRSRAPKRRAPKP